MVLEKALLNLDKRRYNTRLDASRLEPGISRVSTGMPELDTVIEGGIPKGFVVTVTGPPGTGKTTFSMQFLLDGAKNNEKCIFFSFEETVDQLARHFMRFGHNIIKYIDDGYLEIYGRSMISTDEVMDILQQFPLSRPPHTPDLTYRAFSHTLCMQ